MKLTIGFAALLLAAFAVALPNSDDVVPEFASTDAFTQDEMQSAHAEAKAHVNQLMQTGKSQDECFKLADATTKGIKDGVAASQKMLNSVATGAKCASEGAALVKSAKARAAKASSGDTAAKTAAAKAKVAPVKLSSMTTAELKEGDCTAFLNDPAYTKARAAHKAASKKAAESKGAAEGAAKDLLAARHAQREAQDECNCNAKKAQDEAWKAATANAKSNADSWRKAELMKCVLKGTSVNACKIPSVPTVTKPKLASSVTCDKTALYLGCYVDNGSRDFKHGPKQYGYTSGSCAKKCGSKYKYAALQDNGWCSCDNSYSTPSSTYPKKPDGECNKGGTGKGGPWRNAVYDNPYASSRVLHGGSVLAGTIQSKHSKCKTAKHKDDQYLDRQTVKCGDGNVLNWLQFRGCSGNKFRYDFKCGKANGGTGKLTKRYGSCTPLDGKKLQYLDRQRKTCSTGEAIQSFGLTRSGCGGNKMRYWYNCVKLSAGTKRTHKTSCQKAKNEHLQYLDRQKVTCNDNEAISGFKFVGCSGNKFRYDVTCL